MKSNRVKILVLALVVIASGIFIYYETKGSHRSGGQAAETTINPEFAGYISSFTSGFISSNSVIRIKLSSDFSSSTQINTPLEEKYFSFEPAIAGHAEWRDGHTLEFIPDHRLPAGQKYKATFKLSKLTEVKKDLQEFEFYFQIIEQSLQLQVNDLKSYHSNDFTYYSLGGLLTTADFAEIDLLQKCLSATLAGKTKNIKWTHDEAGTGHRFLIDSIERNNKEQDLNINASGSALDVTFDQKHTILVPRKDEFVLLSVKVMTEAEPYILVNFSNPLDQSQTLDGLIRLSGVSEVKYIVVNNQVMIYPNKTNAGTYQLSIDGAIRDARSKALGKTSEHSIVFSEVQPSIRFVGSGNILPSASGLHLAFETVNLRAVDVKIVKIFENNVLQFLQSNKMDGTSQLAQVGKKVVQKRVNLGISNPAELSYWKKFSLDLATLIKAEPGAIYRITLSAKKEYSTFRCAGGITTEQEMQAIAEEPEEEDPHYFGYYDEDNAYYYDEDYYEDYSWKDRDDPCKPTYYKQSERIVSRNILASDLGITLKKGNDGSMFVATTDLITAKPLSNVTVEFYDFQKQLVLKSTTDGDGVLFASPEQRPYFIVAKKDKNFAYLRIDDGAVLTISGSDVGGEAVKKGIKGFIYGERGVWRPGDSLYMTFILEDKANSLPENHPVVFELFNPMGQLYKRLLSTKGLDGFYTFALPTEKNSPTGLWSAQVKVGGVKFQKSVRIENIMPNRLKIEMLVGENEVIQAGKHDQIKLHTNWLTGAVAKNLDAKISVALTSMSTEFPRFKNYEFNDAVNPFAAQNILVFEGKVDEQGNATAPLKLELERNAPGLLRASFNTMVFEPGGAFSVDHFSAQYSPYEYYCGLKLPSAEENTGIIYTNRDQNISIATVDASGKPAARKDLKFEIYKLQWRWWWDQYNNELANYATDDYHKPIIKQTVSTNSNGLAQVTVNIKNADWGRYLIRVSDPDGGHATSMVTYFDWANWMDRGGDGDNKIFSNMLSFTTDKQSYKAGEEVKLTIPAPKNGRALITIENGTKVLESHWLETAQNASVFKFKVRPEMAPNIYVHVSLYQPHARTNDLPIRSYGVIPITVDDPQTHLQPVIGMASVLEPEKTVNIDVSETNGKEMVFTLAIVEQGLLDITRFKTPDPHKSFYAKEALGVKTWDIYDDVIGAYGSELERLLSIGGDGSEMDNDGAKANRFKPVVRFFGPYTLSKNEKKNISFKMPMYVGAVRAMVIAGKKGSYGFAEKSAPVKAPLMILGTLPRVISVGEEVKLPVSVFGGEKNIGATDVKIEVNGFLQVSGQAKQSTNIKKNDEQLVTFDLKAKNQTGIAKVKITATGGGHSAVYNIELDVRNPNPFETEVKDFSLKNGTSLTEVFTARGVSGTNSGAIEISSLPPINLEKRLDYLVGYPHGCIEQTTSRCFAQLYLGDLLELTAIRKTEIEDNIRGGIAALREFQLTDGGMGYWPGSTTPSDWGSSYAGHFLILAEKNGYTLPSGLLKKLMTYQQTAAQQFDLSQARYNSTDQLQAYRLFVLASNNSPALGAMNRLREYSKLSNQARWLLAGAYAQIGQTDEAEKLIAQQSLETEKYRINYYTYGSEERDMALVLQTLCLMNKQTQAFTQLKRVSTFLASSDWLSTQTTAYGLMSVANFVKKFGGSSSMQATCSVNGKSFDLKGRGLSQVPVSFGKGLTANVKIDNHGSSMLFVRMISRGKLPVGEEKEGNENIAINVVYKDMDGNIISPEQLTQGTNFMVTVQVKNLGLLGEIENLALNNYIPSGWEIHNSRMDDNEATLKNSAYTYQDIKDDKVLTYFNLQRNESKTFTTLLNATYEGKYYLPAVNVEAMYDNTVYARTKGQWISVVKKSTGAVAGK